MHAQHSENVDVLLMIEEQCDCVGCLEKRCGGAACDVVTPIRGPVDGFVEGKDVDGLLRADE
jgi:hypothetical protein